jgi:hypothetical protein
VGIRGFRVNATSAFAQSAKALIGTLSAEERRRMMIKEIREDQKAGVVRITTLDERWYAKEIRDTVTGLPRFTFVPSVTWICDYYPKGIGFYKWLANKGWDEAEAIKEAAGDKGSVVHAAITMLLSGATVTMETRFADSGGIEREIATEEWECVLSFAAWFKETKPIVLAYDVVVWNETDNYAGTIDLICKIGDKVYIVDFKTGQTVWMSAELQVSAYKRCTTVANSLAILQLGYRKNKAGYKFTEIEDRFDLFLAAKTIWAVENGGAKPKQRDYPISISLKEEEKNDSDSGKEVRREKSV